MYALKLCATINLIFPINKQFYLYVLPTNKRFCRFSINTPLLWTWIFDVSLSAHLLVNFVDKQHPINNKIKLLTRYLPENFLNNQRCVMVWWLLSNAFLQHLIIFQELLYKVQWIDFHTDCLCRPFELLVKGISNYCHLESHNNDIYL